MKREYLKFLVCPETKEPLNLVDEKLDKDGLIVEGKLRSSKNQYDIIEYIPRFIKNHYAENFGFQWNIFNETQLDKKNTFDISEKRFFETTNWTDNLNGKIILEAGCGMGRFTEHALNTGAVVVSFDLSSAVKANYRNNKNKNLLIIQADILNMPFKDNYFDKIFCFGVVQHTPDPKNTFEKLKKKLKINGEIVIDVYRKHQNFSLLFNSKTRPETRTRHFFRFLTKKLNEKKLYKLVKIYVYLLWPFCTIFNFVPYGKYLSWLLCIADYRRIPHMNFPGNYLDWAILDTYDMLSPAYDNPQTINQVEEWFMDSEFKNVSIKYGYNGIEAKGSLK